VTLVVGSAAPPITARDQHGSPFTLSSYAGVSAVLLVFFPWAFSGRCGGEAAALRDAARDFESAGVRVVGVTCDAMFSLRDWADRESLEFPLLSDHWPHGAIARSYGVFDDGAGVAIRGSFLIDAAGMVRWSDLRGIGGVRDISEYAEAIAALS
jgi:peroxiredoxin (alkyl hydroperoxide reductase subunit C)